MPIHKTWLFHVKTHTHQNLRNRKTDLVYNGSSPSKQTIHNTCKVYALYDDHLLIHLSFSQVCIYIETVVRRTNAPVHTRWEIWSILHKCTHAHSLESPSYVCAHNGQDKFKSPNRFRYKVHYEGLCVGIRCCTVEKDNIFALHFFVTFRHTEKL